MASTESESSYKLANSLSYRTFHASPVKPKDAIECANTRHGTLCIDCKLACNGKTGHNFNIWIDPHGSGKSKAIAVALSSVN